MWLVAAVLSAVFAGLTSILAKCGIRNTDSNVATACRTVVVLAFSWVMVFVQGAQSGLRALDARALLFLVLSGLSTGASWLCYFHALQIGDVNKVTPIDKSSTVLTMVLAFLFLDEQFTAYSAVALVLIGVGTFLMIQKKRTAQPQAAGAGNRSGAWMLYAFGSAVFASLTSILGKVGMEGVPSTLGTAIRTVVVLGMAWLVVFVTKKQHTLREIDKRSWVFLILSGFATGGSWLCYYKALQDGLASVVVPIDKLSILVTIAFSRVVFHEKLTKKAAAGLVMIVAGTLVLLL